MDKDNIIYISGKITGLTRTEYMEQFAKAEHDLQMQGYKVLNPAKTCDTLPSNMPYDCYMNLSLEMLKMASKIYMLDGWGTSKGSTIEFLYAVANGYEIIYETEVKK